MSAARKAFVAIAILLAFVLLTALGAASHKTGTGAFLGAMVAGVVFEIAQRYDRRLRQYRGPRRLP